ncbi:Diacylglycerol O-acyltransferase 1 [Forsythia ovata]|uniref:diacylglycerol O-acyltransferase n=1 Tax=Forsythia ovata TaxID=205694 RepID=A0ABD1SKG2_9LAMI
MAILELPESVETTTLNTHHSRAASTVRRRSSAVAVLESDSNSLEAVNDSDGDVNNNNGMGNLCGGVVELVREKPSESGTEGLSNGKEEEKEQVLTGGSNQGMAAAAVAVAKFSSRPSAPAHRRIKESPLSSDAIFKQSHAGLFNLCIVVLVAVNSRLIIENLMKLVSYAHVNYDMRALAKSLDKGEELSSYWNTDDSYGVTFKSLAYFMVAPTLCYQFDWTEPDVGHTHCVELVETRTVTMELSNTCIEKLNILAELLRFGDREFYKDWWNAKTVDERGAILIAFLVSAIFHEVPLVIITNYLQDKFQNSMVGNMLFWCSFSILGQPMCVLLYYHDLMNRKAGAK